MFNDAVLAQFPYWFWRFFQVFSAVVALFALWFSYWSWYFRWRKGFLLHLSSLSSSSFISFSTYHEHQFHITNIITHHNSNKIFITMFNTHGSNIFIFQFFNQLHQLSTLSLHQKCDTHLTYHQHQLHLTNVDYTSQFKSNIHYLL